MSYLDEDDYEKRKEEYEDWFASLSEEKLIDHEVSEAQFAYRHLGLFVKALDTFLEEMRKDPHSTQSIENIGSIMEDLSKLFKEQLGYHVPMKAGLHHEGEEKIFDALVTIVNTLRDAVRLFYYHNTVAKEEPAK